MYFLLTDETNKEPNDVIKFFIYGGLYIPGDKAHELHTRIQSIRLKSGYKDADLLKFDTNVRPQQVSHASATQAKIDVIEACQATGCKFSALVIHHQIAKKDKPEQKYLWAANHIIGHFNYFLSEVNDYGVCLADSLPVVAPNQYLSDLFTLGLPIEGGAKRAKLDRILLLGSTCINASHLASAIDIVLGTFRFCVNTPSTDDKVRLMLCSVARLMWHRRAGNNKFIAERGLIIRPKNVKAATYQSDYSKLVERVESLIKDV